MKAAYIETTGGPEVIKYGELPTPLPKDREVLIKVGAASVNPIDTYIRAGLVAMPLPKPFIIGCDVAGTVEAIGDAVRHFKIGDRVWGSNQGLFGRQGTSAEYACVSEEWLYPTPAGASDEETAAIALVGITAHLGLFQRAHLKGGETVFVNGGTGGVGSMVVQMARNSGGRVITTVGSAEKAEETHRLGAERTVNYKTDDVPAAIREFTGGNGVDVWFETQQPDFQRTVPLMAPRGRIIVMAGRQAQPIFPVGPFYTRNLSLHGFAMFNAHPDEQRQCAADINRWVAERELFARIGARFPLSEAAAAHRLQEENTLHKAGTLSGKIVLVPNSTTQV